MFSLLLKFIIFFLLILLTKWFASHNASNRSPLKFMLLGIEVTLVGGIIAIDINSYSGGIEFIIIFTGILITIYGFGLEENKKS